MFETVSALSVRAAAEELARRAGAERWVWWHPTQVARHLRICSPAGQLLEPGDRRQGRTSRSTGSVRPRRQGHPSSPCMGPFLSSGFRAGHIVLIGFFVRPGVPFLRPAPQYCKPTRAGAVKVGRRPNLAAYSALARPYLDSFEDDGTLSAVGMTIRGEPAFLGADQIAPRPCIRWVQDPNHDALMRIGGEAPRRRTHSFSRHESQGGRSGPRHLEPSSAPSRA